MANVLRKVHSGEEDGKVFGGFSRASTLDETKGRKRTRRNLLI